MTDSHDRLARALGTVSPMALDVFDTGAVTSIPIGASTIGEAKIRRGRDNARADPSPDTMSTTIVGGTLIYGGRQLSVTRAIRLRLTDVALTRLFGSAVSPTALAARARFTGQVTDLDAEIRAHNRTPQVPLTAASVYSRAAAVNVGLVPWPAGTTDVQILTDILSFAWTDDPGVRIAEWSTTATKAAWWTLIAARAPLPPLGRFVAWDVDNQPVSSVVGDLQASTGGVLIEYRDGRLDWLLPEARRASLPWVSLSADDILSPAKAQQSLADIVTSATATYGPDPQAIVTASDDAAMADHGKYQDGQITTRLAAAVAADDLVDDLVGRYAWPRWNLPTVSVDLLQLWEQGKLAQLRALLTMELGALVELTGFPTTSPVQGGLFWVEGADETIDARRWQLDLNVVAFELLTPPIRWGEVPLAIRWLDVDPSITWLRSTGWQPDPFPIGSWDTEPANIQWRTATPAGATWANYGGM